MVSKVLWTLVIFLGALQFSLAGNQCGNQFPGRGYCINNNQRCPAGSQEYFRLSNGIGCPFMTNRCCVTGNVGGQGITSDRSQCGMGSLPLTSRIFNGINAGPCDWPFVVSIRSKRKTSSQLNYQSTLHICAGVLIDRNWVLTSAVCILNAGKSVREAPSQFIVVAGEYNVTGIDIDPASGGQQEQIINVEQVIIHPNYAYSTIDQFNLKDPTAINGNSVGLIKLAQPINGRCSGIICLPSQTEAQNKCGSYKDCVITGWGFISESFAPPKGSMDILKQGRVKLSSQKGCDLVVNRLGLQKTRPKGTLCQKPAKILTDGCMGDEGGAVMCSSGNNWVVRGILPFQMCTRNKFNLFVTDVSQYLNWIKNTMSYYGRRG